MTCKPKPEPDSRHAEQVIFESGGLEIDLSRRELRARGVTVPIGNRAFEIIETLVKSAGELVTKDELMKRVWPGAIVEDNTIQVHISAIRRALGSDRSVLKTIAGRGYRLLGDWTIRQNGARETSQAPRTVHTTAHSFLTNVPVAASALIGREAAVQHLCDLLSAYRAVTLTGPGGIGKTVLASEVARRLFPTFEGDVFLVELASLSDPDLVPTAVAYALNLQLRSDGMTAQTIARAIGSKRLLVVLDNCEHVIDAAARMAESLIRLCPRTTILATSREVLSIEGEFVYRVSPLEVPARHIEASDAVLGHSAVQLFVTRTRSLRADFQAQREKLPVVAAICRQLDGIPLAIEFAAARAATLGIQQVAGRLDDRFELLTSGRRTALPRHQTLRATLDWSYELLPDAERRLLRHLAIFPAGFTLDAAAGAMGDTESSIALGISSLVSKSLVTLDDSETTRRWRLLETVRAYSLEKLSESGEQTQAARRHAEFYLEMFAPFVVERDLQAAIDDIVRYRREIDNLRAALNWAFSSEGDAAIGIALAASAADFWVAVSLVSEACEWTSKALAHIGNAAGTRYEMVLQCSLGYSLIYTRGMGADARAALMRALALAQEFEDLDYQQRATYGLWLFSSRSMALNDAMTFARDYEVVVRAGDLQSRTTAAWLIGIPETYLAAHAESCERLQWAIDNYPVERRAQDLVRFGADLRTSAMGHNTVNLLSLGLLDSASRSAERAIKEARATNQPTVLCVALAWAAGFVYLSLDELDLAKEHGEELAEHAFKHGLRPYYAAGLCVRGSLAARRGEPELGIDPLRSGLAEMQEAIYLMYHPFFQNELAAALGGAERVDEGLREIDEALRHAGETGYRWFEPELLRTKGDLLARSDTDKSKLIEDLYIRSMSQARAQGAAYWELSAATSLAMLLQKQHREAEARAILAPVYSLCAEGFSAARITRAKALLDQLS
jgi:non-specific serine/threonine protein kinase